MFRSVIILTLLVATGTTCIGQSGNISALRPSYSVPILTIRGDTSHSLTMTSNELQNASRVGLFKLSDTGCRLKRLVLSMDILHFIGPFNIESTQTVSVNDSVKRWLGPLNHDGTIIFLEGITASCPSGKTYRFPARIIRIKNP